MQENRAGDRAKILLIDEDEQIFYLLRTRFARERYRIYAARSGKEGMEMSASLCPDLILMDLKLKDMEGMKLIRWFREWTESPIVIISEQGSCKEKVGALYGGADDYVVKPFHEDELAARIYTVLRRRIPGGKKALYHAGALEIDFNRRRVKLGGEEVHFSPVEYRILECLAANSGAVVTYQMLLERIWGPYASSGSRILRVNMTNIRKKIEAVPMKPEYIITIPRVGYRMLESRSNVADCGTDCLCQS